MSGRVHEILTTGVIFSGVGGSDSRYINRRTDCKNSLNTLQLFHQQNHFLIHEWSLTLGIWRIWHWVPNLPWDLCFFFFLSWDPLMSVWRKPCNPIGWWKTHGLVTSACNCRTYEWEYLRSPSYQLPANWPQMHVPAQQASTELAQIRRTTSQSPELWAKQRMFI